MKIRIKRGAALCAAVLASGILLIPSTGCKKLRFGNMLSTSDEVQLGQQAAKEIDQKAKIITSGPQYDAVQRVAARIIPLARKDYDVPYSVKLIDSKEVNAFALPGGPIYFYKGLVDLTGSDDELASVLGHEATHVVKRHSAKQISDAQTKGLLAQFALGRSSSILQTAASIGLQVDQLHFSREDESESDTYGFKYLTKAGYNPNAMATMFQKLQSKESGGGGPEWLQNHPLTKKRIADAQKRAAEYEKEQSEGSGNVSLSAPSPSPSPAPNSGVTPK